MNCHGDKTWDEVAIVTEMFLKGHITLVKVSSSCQEFAVRSQITDLPVRAGCSFRFSYFSFFFSYFLFLLITPKSMRFLSGKLTQVPVSLRVKGSRFSVDLVCGVGQIIPLLS